MKWVLLGYLGFKAAYLVYVLIVVDKDAPERAGSALIISIVGVLGYWLYMNSGLFG